MAIQDIARIEERLDRAKIGGTAVSDEMGGVVFTNMAEVIEFAKLMAKAGAAIPPHLRGKEGACLAICVQALEWRMSPFAVANKSYLVVNRGEERIAYESQLTHALIETRAPLQGRLRYEILGEGDDRKCRVWGTFKGEKEPHEYVSETLGKLREARGRNDQGRLKGSPLWEQQPEVQLFYSASRQWCRIYAPDTILGIYTLDELEGEQHVGPDKAKEINPKPDIANRLKSKGKRGFDADHVERETKPSEPESGALSAPASDSAASETSDAGQADPQVPPAQPDDGGEARERSSRALDTHAEPVTPTAGPPQEIAVQDAPAGDDEVRAAGDAQGSDGGSPSRNLFQEYLDMIREGEDADPRSVKRQHDKFFTRYPLPEDPDLRAKFERIRTLRLKECNGEDVTMALREAVES